MTASALSPAMAWPGRPLARPGRGRAWAPYLVLLAFLVPLVVPSGPGQIAVVDVLNAVVLAGYAAVVLVGRHKVALPLVGPVLLISVSSLLAVSHSESLSQSVLTLGQDVYLYLWFVMVVTMMRELGDTRRIRIAWVWSANLYAAVGLALSWVENHGQLMRIVGPSGVRASSTFYNPNMFADYIVLSLFVILSLVGRCRPVFLLLSAGLGFVALVTTKSNGGMIALFSGLLAWSIARMALQRRGLPRLLAGALVIVGVGLFVAWVASESGFASGAIGSLREKTFVGRMTHSSESRMRIWDQLQQAYARSPFGIGPGNSGSITLSLAQRERPGSLLSKEAHSDYLAYAIERGPLALLGLLLLLAQVFRLLFRAGKAVRSGRAHVTAAWTAAMTGALVASSVHSTVIEKLHFRHFWLLLALICVVRDRSSAGLQGGEAAARSTPAAVPVRRALPMIGAAAIAPVMAGRSARRASEGA